MLAADRGALPRHRRRRRRSRFLGGAQVRLRGVGADPADLPRADLDVELHHVPGPSAGHPLPRRERQAADRRDAERNAGAPPGGWSRSWRTISSRTAACGCPRRWCPSSGRRCWRRDRHSSSTNCVAWFGFGVAGNFAGHLEQAGEAADFAGVATAPRRPKGHLPLVRARRGHASSASSRCRTTAHRADEPRRRGPLNLQIEPEVGLACAGRLRRHGRPLAPVRARRLQRLLDPAARGAQDQPQEELGAGLQGGCPASSSRSTT